MAAEEAGYEQLIVPDHVLGIHPAGRVPMEYDPIPYTHESVFHEPFVLFGYFAGFTKRIEFVTGVLVLPQRQTALVAKQAAEVDVLSGGRLSLAVGVGWDPVEYEGMRADFSKRGRNIEEQIRLLRQLWAKPVVEFSGSFHTVDRAGINPLPTRQIPIWIGGVADRVLERAGRLGDGWLVTRPLRRDPERVLALVGRVHEAARAVGRDPSEVGVASWIHQCEVPDAEKQMDLARRLERARVSRTSRSTPWRPGCARRPSTSPRCRTSPGVTERGEAVGRPGAPTLGPGLDCACRCAWQQRAPARRRPGGGEGWKPR